MSAVAAVAVELAGGLLDHDADKDAASPEWAWLAVDPEGRCVGLAGSFRECLSACRDHPEIVIDQIVRVPTEQVRAGVFWQRVEVTVKAGPQLEWTFP